MIDKIEFSFLGLELLEPMAMITNLIVVFSCIYGYQKINQGDLFFWRLFFFSFALASFFGGLSHIFWNYWGFYGKISPWFFGVIATSALSIAMIKLLNFRQALFQTFVALILLKALVVLVLAYYHWNFLFVAIDTIGSLLIACGIGALFLYIQKSRQSAKYILYGVLIILPAAFIFLFKFDLHRWMNREDLSHLFIAVGLTRFVKFGLVYSSEK
jgi:hypothetical protein